MDSFLDTQTIMYNNAVNLEQSTTALMCFRYRVLEEVLIIITRGYLRDV